MISKLFSKKYNPSRLFNNFSWLFLDRLIKISFGLLISVWLARYLGPENYGTYSYVLAFVMICASIASLGLETIVIQDLIISQSSKDKIISSAFWLQLFGGVLTSIFALSFLIIFKHSNPLVLVLGLILIPQNCAKASQVIRYFYEAKMLSRNIVRIEGTSFIFFSILKGAFIYLDYGIISIASLILIESFAIALCYLIFFRIKNRGYKFFTFSFVIAKGLLLRSWPMILSSVAVMVYIRIDIFMIESFIDLESVGIYSVASRVNELWYFIPGIIVSSIFPSIVDCYESNKKLYYNRLHFLFSVLFYLGIFISLITMLLSDFIIINLFGLEYREAAYLLSILAWSNIFVFLGVALGRWYVINNMQKLLLYRTIVGGIINILLNYYLIPTYGLYGAAIATLISQAYVNLLANLFSRRTRGIFIIQISSLLRPFLKKM